MMHGEPLMTRGSPCIMGNGWHSHTLKLDAAYLSLIQSSNLPLFSGVAGNGNWSGGSGGNSRSGHELSQPALFLCCPPRAAPPLQPCGFSSFPPSINPAPTSPLSFTSPPSPGFGNVFGIIPRFTQASRLKRHPLVPSQMYTISFVASPPAHMSTSTAPTTFMGLLSALVTIMFTINMSASLMPSFLANCPPAIEIEAPVSHRNACLTSVPSTLCLASPSDS